MILSFMDTVDLFIEYPHSSVRIHINVKTVEFNCKSGSSFIGVYNSQIRNHLVLFVRSRKTNNNEKITFCKKKKKPN